MGIRIIKEMIVMTNMVLDDLKIETTKKLLIEKGGFHKTLLASGSAKLVKPLADGSRVHVKEIDANFIYFDIDPDDPEKLPELIDHIKSYVDWQGEGAPDKTVKVKVSKVKKNAATFNWVRAYEKKFERYVHPKGYKDYRRKPSFFQRVKNFVKK